MNYPAIVQSAALEYQTSEADLIETLQATIMPGQRATKPQVHALLFVCQRYGLDPWRKEIHAFPDKGGIMPVMGVDGWLRKANEHPAFDGLEVTYGREDDDLYCEVVVHRSDRKHSPPIREWLSECKRNTGPWKQMPKRMLRNRALAQAVRVSFGISGILLTDEAEGAQDPRDVSHEDVAPVFKKLELAEEPQESVSAKIVDGPGYEPAPVTIEQEEAPVEAEGRVLSDAEADADLFGAEPEGQEYD